MSRTTWQAELAFPVSPDRDHIRGRPNAPVTLVEYGDYECPFCGAANLVVTEILSGMGNELCFVFRHFPLTTVHPHAQLAAEAAEAAGVQDAFWPMHDTLIRTSSGCRKSIFWPRPGRSISTSGHLPRISLSTFNWRRCGRIF